MLKLDQTTVYKRWFAKLRDHDARVRIDMRLARLVLGNPGDVRFVGGSVLELKIDYGPGYRVYYTRKDKLVILLLAGGDKRTQQQDIRRAIELASASRS